MAPISPSANAEDIREAGSIPGSGRSPGGCHGYPLQYSCLENPMDRGAWQLQSIGLQRVRHNWSDLACMRKCNKFIRCPLTMLCDCVLPGLASLWWDLYWAVFQDTAHLAKREKVGQPRSIPGKQRQGSKYLLWKILSWFFGRTQSRSSEAGGKSRRVFLDNGFLFNVNRKRSGLAPGEKWTEPWHLLPGTEDEKDKCCTKNRFQKF